MFIKKEESRMSKYEKPEIDVIQFSPEEIRTSIITDSTNPSPWVPEPTEIEV